MQPVLNWRSSAGSGPVFAEFSKAGGIFSPNILQKGVVKRVGFVYNLEPTGKWSKR
jgi:hypothetical protein